MWLLDIFLGIEVVALISGSVAPISVLATTILHIVFHSSYIM